MLARTIEETEALRLLLQPFASMGYPMFPVLSGRKQPRDTGWQTREYRQGELKRWVAQGGNLGIALRATDLVIDVDPRNYTPADNPLTRLCADTDSDLVAAPTVVTGRGDGGLHLYFAKPAGVRVVGKLPQYPGIDFRSEGSFVVAPGSVHPDTGGIYTVDGPPISAVSSAPDALLALIAREDTASRISGEGVGKLTNEQLAKFLAVLDPYEYGPGQHDRWFALMAACHDATAGHGLSEWLAWCARDDRYGEAHDEATARRWTGLKAGKRGGANYRTLFKAVVEAGRPDLVASFEDGDDGDLPTLDVGTEDLPRYHFGGE